MTRHSSNTIFCSFRMGSLWENPMLTSLLGITPAVLICTSLKQGALLAGASLCAFLPIALLTWFFLSRLPGWARLPLYVLCSAAILLPLASGATIWFPQDMAGVNSFLPLLLVNSALFLMWETLAAGVARPRRTLSLTAGMLTGYLLALLLLSAVREWLANGSLWGITVTESPLFPAAASPFAALLLLGLPAALLQWSRLTFHREENAQ